MRGWTIYCFSLILLSSLRCSIDLSANGPSGQQVHLQWQYIPFMYVYIKLPNRAVKRQRQGRFWDFRSQDSKIEIEIFFCFQKYSVQRLIASLAINIVSRYNKYSIQSALSSLAERKHTSLLVLHFSKYLALHGRCPGGTNKTV